MSRYTAHDLINARAGMTRALPGETPQPDYVIALVAQLLADERERVLAEIQPIDEDDADGHAVATDNLDEDNDSLYGWGA